MTVVAVPLALTWLWRCETEGTIVPGSDLRVVSQSRDSLIPLSESTHNGEVARDRLRHTCGGRVIPIAPSPE
jgi:hypothetical protein